MGVVDFLIKLGDLLKLVESGPDTHSVLLQDNAVYQLVRGGDCLFDRSRKGDDVAVNQDLNLGREGCEENPELEYAVFQLDQQAQAIPQTDLDCFLYITMVSTN